MVALLDFHVSTAGYAQIGYIPAWPEESIALDISFAACWQDFKTIP